MPRLLVLHRVGVQRQPADVGGRHEAEVERGGGDLGGTQITDSAQCADPGPLPTLSSTACWMMVGSRAITSSRLWLADPWMFSARQL